LNSIQPRPPIASRSCQVPSRISSPTVQKARLISGIAIGVAFAASISHQMCGWNQ
jgi:hypothetical protein